MFYFVLGNLSPKYRSKLSAIQLVAIAKQKDLSLYGMDAVLQPFVEHIKRLVRNCMYIGLLSDVYLIMCHTNKENGCDFIVDGRTEKIYGTLAAISADNLGSLALGGFKESCSSFRCCRHCMATQETAKSKVKL